MEVQELHLLLVVLLQFILVEAAGVFITQELLV
jgi:hypothetical protein